MWTIHSETWGAFECDSVYPSASFEGRIAAHGVQRDGKEVWEKAYFLMHDLTIIVPPKEWV